MNMLGKRMHSNNSKNGILSRTSCKGKDLLTRTSTFKYNKIHLAETGDNENKNIVFPYHRPSENTEKIPCYTSIISRTPEEGIGMKDLDQLQQELEKLLSVSVVRNRILSSELDVIDKVEERHDKKGKFVDKPLSPKCRKVEDKVKNLKESKPAYKLVRNVHDETQKIEAPRVLPKNDTESKFWLSVDPYCCAVTGDDSTFLDELIQETNKDVDVKLNDLGEHYTKDWTIVSEQDKSSTSKNNKSKGNAATTNGLCTKKNGFFGGESYSNTILPLASALLEENVNNISVSQETLKEIGMTPLNNSVCIDKRLRNELVELGILDSEDNSKPVPQEDEIAQQINMCHDELVKINECNRRELNRLRNIINKNLARQEFVQKLDEVDNKVMDVYQKLLASNPKTRNDIEWEAVRLVQLQKELHKETMEISDFLL